MFGNILLAVDLNHEASWTRALPAAAEIARHGGGELHILSVLPDFGMTMVGGFFPKDFEQKALARIGDELDAFIADKAPQDVTVRGHVGHGPVFEEILRVAADRKCGLIVMASHPPGLMRELLVGSNAEKVVRAATVSVLVVRG